MPNRLRWPSSLWARLLLASLLLMPAFLLVSGYLLDRSFRESQQTAQQSQLQSQIYLLLAAAEWDGTDLWLPDTLQEPGFNQPDSGLYGFVTSNEGELWRSTSAQFQLRQWSPAVFTSITPGNTGFDQQVIRATSEPSANRKQTAVAVFYFDTLWEGGGDSIAEDGSLPESSSIALRFYVVQDLNQSKQVQRAYRRQLSSSLGALMVTLLLLQLAIVRWGLRPLTAVSRELQAIEQGKQQQLLGHYPEEIRPITGSFNQVLANEQTQRERYRTTLGDLAHSLKTPLAVIQGELHEVDPASARETLAEQCTRMDQIIQHQLRRAVAGQQTFAEATPIQPMVERLCGALGKVYKDKAITFTQQISDGCVFYGTGSDLMEVMGNLLDNACKFCRHTITISAQQNAGQLTLCIDDDGPGLPADQQQELLQRGARADTAHAGQGIGLAVAIDIISSYQGALALETSPHGGARFKVSFHQRQQTSH